MLRIHGNEPGAAALRLVQHQFPGAYQGLLIGQGDALARADGGQRRAQTHHTHYGGQYGIGPLQGRRFQQPLHAGGHPHLRIRQPDAQVGGGRLIHQHGKLRSKGPALRLQPLHIPVGRQRGHSHATGGNHLQ